MFTNLSDRLEGTFKKLRGLGKISEKNVTDALREVRMALLEADVDFKVAKEFIASVKDKAMGQEVMKSVTPGQQIVKVFHDELEEVLGGDAAPLDLDPPQRILVVGLNGAGKTTSSAKLALHLKNAGKRPLLVACDLYRPAAIEQLATLAEEIGVPMFRPAEGETDPVKAVKEAMKWVDEKGGGIGIYDTAGRQEVDEALIGELKEIRSLLNAKEVLLVADSATGQQAVSVATTFDEAVGVTGIVLTKLDGDARGGAALSMRSVTGKPIKFAGLGEKMDAFEVFTPSRVADRILGMGDVVGLVEKAAEHIDEDEALRMAKKLKEASFDLEDFLSQMQMMKKMGGIGGLLGMLPGAKKLKDLDMDEGRMKHTEAIILSMTPKERKRPELINGSRRKRIAGGSGTSIQQVNQLLRQFAQMRKLFKKKGKMKALMDQMGDMGGLGGGGMGGGGLPPGLGGLK